MAASWFKPPLSIYIIWACCGTLMLVCGSRTRRRLCGFFCFWCKYNEEQTREQTDHHEETHEHLPSTRRQEMDNLQSVEIIRCLARFTMTLKKENMIRQLPDTDSQNLADEDNISPGLDTNCTEAKEKQNGIIDVEMGYDNITSDGNAVEDLNLNEDAKYTHVLVPYPGCDIDGAHVNEPEDCSAKERKYMSISLKSFRQKSKVNVESDGEEEKDEEDKGTTDKEDSLKEADGKRRATRAVPSFCAVCLMEYNVSERICWASNNECTHIFHEDCILQWLDSLGRKRSQMQRSGNKLLDYDLDCPCCRQDFISKSLVHAPHEEESA